MINQIVSRYKILRTLGGSEMSEVYLAEDVDLHRKVAIKFLSPVFAAQDEFRERFKHEAQAAASINHPNSVTIHEVGEFAGRPYIVMEYIEGESLGRRMARQALPLADILEIALQICEGLRKAHQQGIWHRDIKPDNILLDAEGRVKIVDFGLAKLRQVNTLTLKGTIMGTPRYMSPEQVAGETLDQRSDIFSLGIVLYEMIAGVKPFKGETWKPIANAILHHQPEPLAKHNRGVTASLQSVLDKALAKNRDARYQNIESLLADLKREKKLLAGAMPSTAITHSAPTRRRHKKIYWALAGGLAVILLIFLLNKFPRLITGATGNTKSTAPVRIDSTTAMAAQPADSLVPVDQPATSDSAAAKASEPPQKETVSLFGSLVIGSQPSDADIILNNETKGKTPQTLRHLAAGDYRIVFKKEGYEDESTTIAVERGKAKNINASLRLLKGKLRVLIKPSGSIFIDGVLKVENAADWREMNLDAGSYKVRMESPGLGHWEKSIVISPNQTKELPIDFSKTVDLIVTAKDEMNQGLNAAAIYIDDKDTGEETQKRLPVRVGYHTIAVRLNGYLPGEKQSVNLEEGPAQRVNFILKKEQP